LRVLHRGGVPVSFNQGSMAEPSVKFAKQGNVGIFTLNRPKARNAVNAELAAEFEAHLEAFEADDDLWVGIVESSNDTVFCAGADLKSINAGKPVFTAKGGFAGFVQYPRTKPMIACVDGAALAGGCEIVLACDLVVASTKAKFGVPEVKRSLIAAAGGLFRLPRKLPHAIAMELLLTGDPMTCERAHALGFVNVACAPGEALKEALALAQRITANAPLAVREAKACVDEMTTRNMDQADFKRSNAGFGAIASTPDFMEGPLAFIEKRPPRWTGQRSKL